MAIDGPAASGKSTVGRMAAQRLGLRFLDTGIMYRAVTWLALRRGVDVDDADAVAELARRCPISIVGGGEGLAADGGGLTIGGHTPGGALWDAAVDAAVSAVSAAPGVRTELVRQQRAIGKAGGESDGIDGGESGGIDGGEADGIDGGEADGIDEGESGGIDGGESGGIDGGESDGIDGGESDGIDGGESDGIDGGMVAGIDGGIVMAGRDIGSVVLPDAEVKLYITASAEERARRRMAQRRNADSGSDGDTGSDTDGDGTDSDTDGGGESESDFGRVLADTQRRDGLDSGRAHSPLTVADGAIVINTDGLSLEESVVVVIDAIHAAVAAASSVSRSASSAGGG